VVLVVVAVACGGCGKDSSRIRGASPAGAPQVAVGDRLTGPSLRMFVTVRNRALQRLEEALADTDQAGAVILTRVKDLGAAERESAEALGVEWRVYARVRDHLARLLTAQRQREDRTLLAAELSRAQQDLSAQLSEAHDPASRQFLEAQINGLTQQLERLKKEQVQGPREIEELRVLESGRADIALLQGRQEKIQRRLQDLLARAVTPAPTSTASVPRPPR
jgi:hypothetical protein